MTLNARFLAAALLWCSLLAAAELAMQAPLEPESLTGCVIDNGVLRLPDPLPTQDGANAIVVEAEAFQSVAWQGDAPGGRDDRGAGGGRCIAVTHEAIYHFNVQRAGPYHYWQRVRIPRRASWSHTVQIDDTIPMQLAFGTRKQDQAQIWFWIRSEKRYLKPGVHTLAVRNLYNGKQLDRWVLTTDADWEPDGVGPAATAITRMDGGCFVSTPLEPLALLSWGEIELTAAAGADLQVATGDAPFVPLQHDQTIAGRATPLRVRVSLRRHDDGTSPEVRLGNVHYKADPGAFVRLENGNVQLLLDRRTGRICGLRNAADGRRFLPDGVPATLFELESKHCDTPDITRLCSDSATLTQVTSKRRKAVLDYAFAEGKVRARVTFELTRDWMIEARLRLENDADSDVITVAFPSLAQARAGNNSSDDILCFPSMTGRLIAQPGAAGTLTNTHPIRTTIGFCDLYDKHGGLCLAPLDYPMMLTEFASVPDPSRQSTTLSLTRRDRVKSGSSATFTAGFGVHAGDWHTAADWYRGWFEEHVGKPRIPDWVRNGDGWVTSSETERMAGLGFDHIQMWRETGYGGCPTYYYPNPNYHSESWFRDLASTWRALGGHLGVYYHANGMSRSYLLARNIYGVPVTDIPEGKRPPAWNWFVQNHGYGPDHKPVEKLDMSNVPEPAAKEEYPTMCWQAGTWRDYLEKWAIDVYLGEYGLDTPYWDTFACRDRQEFNPHHKLNGEGRGAMARYRFLLDMQRRGDAMADGFYQLVEGGSELLGLVAGQLQSNFVQNLEVGRYTHPDQVYYIGHSNGWWNAPRTHLAACMAFRLNTKLDLIRLTPKVMEVVRCRRWFAPWLNRAQFMDTVGLGLAHNEVKGALHVSRNRRGDALIATFMNWQGIQGVTASIDVARYIPKQKRLHAFLVSQGQTPSLLRPSAPDPSAWNIPIPASPVSAVLFLERPDRAMPVAQARQEEARQLIQVFDSALKPRTFRITIDTAEATFRPYPVLGDTDGVFTLDSTPPADNPDTPVSSRTIDYTDYAALTQLRHANITLKARGVTLRTRSLIAPLFIDPDFEREQFDDAHTHTGTRSLRIVPAQMLRHFPLELIPQHRYRISLWIRKLETKGTVAANVHHHLNNKSHHFGHGTKPGEWCRVETTYTMPKGWDQPHLYLYNWQGTTEPAWFDSVQITDLGPAPGQ